MTTTPTPIIQAVRLLRAAAHDLKDCHTRGNEDWTGEAEAKAAHDEHMAVADALEAQAAAKCLHQIQEPAALAEVSKEQYARMFGAACDALGEISDHLGIDSDINPGAEPIIEAIDELRAAALRAAPAADAQHAAAWMTPEGDRVVTEITMAGARKDGGAILSSLRPYSVALVRAQAQEAARDALTLEELDQLDRAIEHFCDDEDTDVNWRLLTRAASLGYLEYERFRVPPTARAAIDAARAALAAAPQAPAAPVGEAQIAAVMELVKDWSECDLIAAEAGISLSEDCSEKEVQNARRLDAEAVTAYRAIVAALRSLIAAAPAAPAVDARADSLPSWWPDFIQCVAELPDRDSPEGEPDAIIATAEELGECAIAAQAKGGEKP